MGGEPYVYLRVVGRSGEVEVLGVDDEPGGALALHIWTRRRPTCGACSGPV